jgi:hypothetical protein
MKASGYWLERQVGSWLVLLLFAPFAIAGTLPPLEAQPSELAETGSSAEVRSHNSDGDTVHVSTEASSSETLPDSPGAVRSQAADDNRQSTGQQSSAQRQQQDSTPEPVGTAAAPPLKTTGVAASRPAGAAIAPGKQRRARSILIKVGAIMGAGVAVGTVVALSSGSPSRPPGSR